MLLDLSDLSNLLIVRYVKFVTHCLISSLYLIGCLLFVTHYMICFIAQFVTYVRSVQFAAHSFISLTRYIHIAQCDGFSGLSHKIS